MSKRREGRVLEVTESVVERTTTRRKSRPLPLPGYSGADMTLYDLSLLEFGPREMSSNALILRGRGRDW